MNLRTLNESDLAVMVEDDTDGWAFPVTVINPDEVSADLKGLTNDIYEVIDPDLGVVVSGRNATISLRISSLTAAGLGLPIGIISESSRPWTVEFKDLEGNDYLFKVVEGRPDRTVGIITCILEAAVDDT